MPSESEPVSVEPAPEVQVDFSKVWLCKKAFHGLKISPQACGIHSTQKIDDMSDDHLLSDTSTYVKKRSQQDDSILLRHVDEVVGTGPDEHLMSDFEHLKTRLVFDGCGGVAQRKRYSWESWNHQDKQRLRCKKQCRARRFGKFEVECKSKQSLYSDGARGSNVLWNVTIIPNFAKR